MLESASVDIAHLFIFVVPGFVTVWSFRYFTDSKKHADFEYFALSVFWGLLILSLYESITANELVKTLLANQYAAAIVLSGLGLICGWMGGILSKTKLFHKVITWFKKYPWYPEK